MHVVYVSRELVPSLRCGGIGSYVCDVSRQIAARGHRVTVVCASDDTRKTSNAVIEGVRVVRLPGGDFAIRGIEPAGRSPATRYWRSLTRHDSYRRRVAERVAYRCGVEHRFIPRHDDYLAMPEFTRTFGAETDAAAHHIGEPGVLDCMLREGFSRSLYRGDECFGWLGPVQSAEEALAAVGIRPLTRLRNSASPLFRDEVYSEMTRAQSEQLAREVDRTALGSPVDLKDRCYFEHRLARYLHPLSYYKLSRVEVFNPLLDTDVLRLLEHVPADHRIPKRVEHRVLARRFPALMDVPLASRAAPADNTRQWQQSPELRDFVLGILTREGKVWSQLIRADALRSWADACLRWAPRARGWFRRVGADLARVTGLRAWMKSKAWHPVTHAQPSPLRLLQRLTVVRLWLDQHESKLLVGT